MQIRWTLLDRYTVLLLLECTAVFLFLLLPPLFSGESFVLPQKPSGPYAQLLFFFKTFLAAAYEEVLYRLYTPNRLHLIYTRCTRLLRQAAPADSLRILHWGKEYSVHQERFFAFFLTEFPALLLFALAHRYLGIFSLLFAAGAGAVFRSMYIMLKRKVPPAVGITVVAIVHGVWNSGVYFYFLGHPNM